MGVFAALDVSQEETAICVVGQDGVLVAETKVPTCPDAITGWLKKLSATALSWQFPRRLIECSRLWARRKAAQS
ncbi:hypothetical protein SAMN05878503_1101, partial [Cereibacter ovatus]